MEFLQAISHIFEPGRIHCKFGFIFIFSALYFRVKAKGNGGFL